MNQAAEAEFTGVPGSELPVRQTRREGPAMLLDRTLAAICCGSMATVICASEGGGFERRQM